MRLLTKYLIYIVLLISTYWDSNMSCRSVVLNKASSLNGQLVFEDIKYVIKYSFDLKGKSLNIPKGCQLVFEGGRFYNGTIIGNNTTVSADRYCIFDDVIIDGNWKNKRVYSEWLDFIEGEKVDNARNFKNLMLLCNSDEMTHLYMQKGVYYCSVAYDSSNINVPSNVYWHNEATLCQLPTDYPRFSFILLHKSINVTIDGGVFVGDVQSHIGGSGEWGHGIKVAGAKNVVLKNLVSREFWGDGIDIVEADYVSSISAGVGPCESITIDSVKCFFNRRQGLSIEAGKNVTVKHSEFAYTGMYKITEPGCGVDIEPWCKNEEKIDNIRFYNCYIHDNNPKRDFCLEPNLQYYDKTKPARYAPENRIVIKNCKIGKLYVLWANGVSITDCDIVDISHYNFGENIKITNSIIREQTGVKTRRGLIIRRCKR